MTNIPIIQGKRQRNLSVKGVFSGIWYVGGSVPDWETEAD